MKRTLVKRTLVKRTFAKRTLVKSKVGGVDFVPENVPMSAITNCYSRHDAGPGWMLGSTLSTRFERYDAAGLTLVEMPYNIYATSAGPVSMD